MKLVIASLLLMVSVSAQAANTINLGSGSIATIEAGETTTVTCEGGAAGGGVVECETVYYGGSGYYVEEKGSSSSLMGPYSQRITALRVIVNLQKEGICK